MTDFISKILIFFFTVASFFTIAQPSDVEITVNEVTTESTSISFTYQNKTGKIMSEINSYKLEKNVDGEWVDMELVVFIPEVAYRTYPNTQVKDGFQLLRVDGDGLTITDFKLGKGEYRLTISYRIYEFSKGWTKAEASTVFTVTE